MAAGASGRHAAQVMALTGRHVDPPTYFMPYDENDMADKIQEVRSG